MPYGFGITDFLIKDKEIICISGSGASVYSLGWNGEYKETLAIISGLENEENPQIDENNQGEYFIVMPKAKKNNTESIKVRGKYETVLIYSSIKHWIKIKYQKKRYFLYILSFYVGLLLPAFCIANIRSVDRVFYFTTFKKMNSSVQIDWFSKNLIFCFQKERSIR